MDVLEGLVDRYAHHAAEHGRATEAGVDPDMTNRHHDEVAECYRVLRHHGVDAQRRLLVLLDNDDPWVVAWAGAHALEFAPDVGEAALDALAEQDTLPGLTAMTTVSSWRSGSLRFP